MPFPHNSQTYFQFMQAIAMNHVDILHNPDRSASQGVAFGEIFISSDPYDKIDISTFMEDIKSKLKVPCMLAIGTDWEGQGKGDQTSKTINASFIILDKEDATQPDSASKRRAAYVKTERIADEISAYIKKYFEINVILGSLVMQPVGEKIGPIMPGKFYGTKVSFSYLSRQTNLCFNQDKFGLLIPSAETVPGCCTDTTPNPDYCDILSANLTAQQRACLQVAITNSDNSLSETAQPASTFTLDDIILTVKDLDGNVIATFVKPAGVNIEVSVDAGTGTGVGLNIDEVNYNIEAININVEEEII